jgi:hypothetical protein
MDFGQKLNSPVFRAYKVGFRVFSGITFSGSVRVRASKKVTVRVEFSSFRVPDTSLVSDRFFGSGVYWVFERKLKF